MQAPTIWIQRERAPRVVHRFEGETPHSPVIVLTPDAREAREVSAALRERQARRITETGSAFGGRLQEKRPRWRG